MSEYSDILNYSLAISGGLTFGLGVFNAAIFAAGIMDRTRVRLEDVPKYRTMIRESMPLFAYYLSLPGRELVYFLKAK
jgi:hypothetical protein